MEIIKKSNLNNTENLKIRENKILLSIKNFIGSDLIPIIDYFEDHDKIYIVYIKNFNLTAIKEFLNLEKNTKNYINNNKFKSNSFLMKFYSKKRLNEFFSKFVSLY